MAKATTAATPKLKMPKLPKSMGACVDLYKKWQVERLAAKKDVDALEEIEKGIKAHIIDNLPKGDTGAVGTDYVGRAYNETMYVIEDWDKFYAHIRKTGEFDLLNRAVNQAAIKERVGSQEPPKTEAARKKWRPKLPPGVRSMNVVKLSVTKK